MLHLVLGVQARATASTARSRSDSCRSSCGPSRRGRGARARWRTATPRRSAARRRGRDPAPRNHRARRARPGPSAETTDSRRAARPQGAFPLHEQDITEVAAVLERRPSGRFPPRPSRRGSCRGTPARIAAAASTMPAPDSDAFDRSYSNSQSSQRYMRPRYGRPRSRRERFCARSAIGAPDEMVRRGIAVSRGAGQQARIDVELERARRRPPGTARRTASSPRRTVPRARFERRDPRRATHDSREVERIFVVVTGKRMHRIQTVAPQIMLLR